jgi:hypothetical protein
MWLCDANDEAEGYVSVTSRARAWKAGSGSSKDLDWVRISATTRVIVLMPLFANIL